MTDHVLVTGGAGYIGSHVCKLLAGQGRVPVTLDNLSRGNRDLVRWGPLVEGDIADPRVVADVIGRYGITEAIHFAAYAYVGESMGEPGLYYANNVSGSIAFLDAARQAGLRHVVFSSTCAVYGVPDRIPIVETTPTRPINPYGRGKLMIEGVLADFAAAYGLSWTALRYFNAAGADPGGETGERHAPETHAIPLAIDAALFGGPEFRVMGTDYDTPDGTAVRDYIHVMDLGQAHLAALVRLRGGGAPDQFNLGTGIGVSVAELVAAVEKATGRPVPKSFAPRRPGDPPSLVADASKALAGLGWRPQHSSVDEIMATAVAWHRKDRG